MAYQLTEKEKKYDRQMRLWGGHGQERLETAHICVLGSGPTASELLKNLVLPNVGEFTIVDDAVVSESDLGNNFFVDVESIGKSRAEVVRNFMNEMNPEVKGNHVAQSPVELIKKNMTFFAKFTLVVATQLSEDPLRKLAQFLYEKRIPLVIMRAYGLIGYVRNIFAEQLIVETHPDKDQFDLYIHPQQIVHFPKLKQWIDSFDLKNCDDYQHAHTPYIVILGQLIQQWVKEHGKVPQNYDQQKAFKQTIEKARRKNDADTDQENFDEAVNFAYRAYNLPEPNDKVSQVLNDSKGKDLTSDSADFWVLIAALNEWRAKEGHGLLPVSTSLPDMTSETKHYVTLKNIFAEKANEDMKAIAKYTEKVLTKIGRKSDSISQRQIEYFVRNVRNLGVIRTRTLEDEYNPQSFLCENINESLGDYIELTAEETEMKLLKPHNLHWYFALRSVDEFYQQKGRFPGTLGKDSKEVDISADAVELNKINAKLLSTYKIRAAPVSECLEEIARYGATEIHNISAFLGGIGAQEVLKILIQQYVPLNNTAIFNGIHGSLSVVEL